MFPNRLFPPKLFAPRVFPRRPLLPRTGRGGARITWRGGAVNVQAWVGENDVNKIGWNSGSVIEIKWEGAMTTELKWLGENDTLLKWEGNDDQESRLDWAGKSDGRITWVGSQCEGVEMQESCDNPRRQVPQLIEYTFQNKKGIIDLTPYSSVTLIVKRNGVLFASVTAQFSSPKSSGQVYYDGYQFNDTGKWWAQFVAKTAGNVPLYGDLIGFDVVPNLDDLLADETPQY